MFPACSTGKDARAARSVPSPYRRRPAFARFVNRHWRRLAAPRRAISSACRFPRPCAIESSTAQAIARQPGGCAPARASCLLQPAASDRASRPPARSGRASAQSQSRPECFFCPRPMMMRVSVSRALASFAATPRPANWLRPWPASLPPAVRSPASRRAAGHVQAAAPAARLSHRRPACRRQRPGAARRWQSGDCGTGR